MKTSSTPTRRRSPARTSSAATAGVSPGADETPLAAPAQRTHPQDPQRRLREAAYRRYEMRGGAPGDALTDWLEAEAELAREDAAPRH